MDCTPWEKSAEHSSPIGHYRAPGEQNRQGCFSNFWSSCFRVTGQGVANCCKYAHTGHPRLRFGSGERVQYISRPGLRRPAQNDWVAAARGMEGWLRHPRPADALEPKWLADC